MTTLDLAALRALEKAAGIGKVRIAQQRDCTDDYNAYLEPLGLHLHDSMPQGQVDYLVAILTHAPALLAFVGEAVELLADWRESSPYAAQPIKDRTDALLARVKPAEERT